MACPRLQDAQSEARGTHFGAHEAATRESYGQTPFEASSGSRTRSRATSSTSLFARPPEFIGFRVGSITAERLEGRADTAVNRRPVIVDLITVARALTLEQGWPGPYEPPP